MFDRRVKEDGVRYTFCGVISNVRSREYSGGSMLLFDAEDASGVISGIVWNDCYNAFHDVLKQGESFKFCAVMVKANPRNRNRLEIKMYSDTRVERCEAVSITRTYDTIERAKSGGRDTVYVKGVVSDVSEQVETMRSGDEMRRGVIIDPTGEAPFFLLGQAVEPTLVKGDVVHFDGRMTSGGAIFVNFAAVVVNDALAVFFEKLTSPPSLKKQRVEPTISRILDVKTSDVGTRGEFNAIVRSASAVGAQLANDRVKHTFVLIDPSMGAVEVGCFMHKADPAPQVEVGDSVRVEATVSSYNTRSLTTNAVVKTNDEGLREWYKEVTDSTSFEDISVDPRAGAGADATETTATATSIGDGGGVAS